MCTITPEGTNKRYTQVKPLCSIFLKKIQKEKTQSMHLLLPAENCKNKNASVLTMSKRRRRRRRKGIRHVPSTKEKEMIVKHLFLLVPQFSIPILNQ